MSHWHDLGRLDLTTANAISSAHSRVRSDFIPQLAARPSIIINTSSYTVYIYIYIWNEIRIFELNIQQQILTMLTLKPFISVRTNVIIKNARENQVESNKIQYIQNKLSQKQVANFKSKICFVRYTNMEWWQMCKNIVIVNNTDFSSVIFYVLQCSVLRNLFSAFSRLCLANT